MVPAALQQLIDHIDRDLVFALETEHGMQRSDIANYDEVRQAIVEKLEMLRDQPIREENPVIYHLDVNYIIIIIIVAIIIYFFEFNLIQFSSFILLLLLLLLLLLSFD